MGLNNPQILGHQQFRHNLRKTDFHRNRNWSETSTEIEIGPICQRNVIRLKKYKIKLISLEKMRWFYCIFTTKNILITWSNHKIPKLWIRLFTNIFSNCKALFIFCVFFNWLKKFVKMQDSLTLNLSKECDPSKKPNKITTYFSKISHELRFVHTFWV